MPKAPKHRLARFVSRLVGNDPERFALLLDSLADSGRAPDEYVAFLGSDLAMTEAEIRRLADGRPTRGHCP